MLDRTTLLRIVAFLVFTVGVFYPPWRRTRAAWGFGFEPYRIASVGRAPLFRPPVDGFYGVCPDPSAYGIQLVATGLVTLTLLFAAQRLSGVRGRGQ
jgi:hypothetical protein